MGAKGPARLLLTLTGLSHNTGARFTRHGANASGEESKWGGNLKESAELVKEAMMLPGICVKGLMTVAPYTENPEENRVYFSTLKQLLVDIEAQNTDNNSMGELSMGMTGDYEVAIEEGATYVRVGTGIFGERNYTI